MKIRFNTFVRQSKYFKYFEKKRLDYLTEKFYFFSENRNLSKFNSNNLRELAFFKELNLTYNHIRKSGNTNIFNLIFDIYQQNKIIDNYISTNSVSNFRSKKLIKLSDKYNKEFIQNILNSTIFTFVRDPYARALSMFRDKVVGREIAVIGKYFDYTNDKFGFNKFLHHVHDNYHNVNMHFKSQYDHLFFPLEKYDFIGKLENFENDFKILIRQLNIRLNIQTDFHRSLPHHTNSKNLLTRYLDKENKKIIQLIYQKDFEKFAYEI